ncbi:MAG TPA: arginine--tRNA ligase [Terriglobales bacterium]|nr:arginine--tRNA ligase [Terriglobales bacterium]
MYRYFQQILTERVRDFLRQKYELELEGIITEQPPRIELGEYALPLSFELAKKLRKAPRKIAEEIVSGIGYVPGFQRLEVAGAGYINARLKRTEVAALLARGDQPVTAAEASPKLKILVEHSSINPNKAAHIGHLRNAILGDTFVRLLRFSDFPVDVQNYIDNTGVQVADVVVGFLELEKRSRADVEKLIEQSPRFDYICWDVYARTSSWYEENRANQQKRAEVLHAIEQGNNDVAELANLISTAVLHRHLETMDRLAIEYDFLPRESEILHLNFWALAFEQMKQKSVLYYETQGKNAGCWVMKRPTAMGKKPEELTDEDTKVIVRSNGTVGYVGKDIAYHLWKFGLLGRDFGYRKFYRYPTGLQCWISAEHGDPNHPHFGDVSAVYNVIDTRQSEAQNTVIEALRGMGYTEAADHYTHFSYEMVALTPRCAEELGYPLSEDEMGKPFIEVSGRRGFGVKADDLIDRLIATAQKEVDVRHPDLSEAERKDIATQIAVGALRYFMLKFTKTSVIAFDFKEALSFEGETGPYVQYAVVRASNIFRKAGVTPEQVLAEPVELCDFLEGESGTEIWELWLTSSKTSYVVEQCIFTTEPAHAAKHAFQLAQLFNNFYHRHRILTESDPLRRKFLLATAAVVRRELIRILAVMGITTPPVM